MLAAAHQRGVGRTAFKAAPAECPHEIVVRIMPPDPNAPPIKRPSSSRTIARMRERAEAEARNAAAAQALVRQVQPRLRPSRGRLFDVDVAGLMLRGPTGGIGSSSRIIETLSPLATGGRHSATVLVDAGKWAGEAALRDALKAVAPKLDAIGLRICWRKPGLRMAKAR